MGVILLSDTCVTFLSKRLTFLISRTVALEEHALNPFFLPPPSLPFDCK